MNALSWELGGKEVTACSLWVDDGGFNKYGSAT